MTKLLGDRLAEAFAETLHRRVRTELWGYRKPDAFTPKDGFAGRYRGIRPAFGTLVPGSLDERDIFRLMRVTEATGIALTESYSDARRIDLRPDLRARRPVTSR